LSLFLIAFGVQISLLTFISNLSIIIFIKQITAGFLLGVGLVLFDMFITLAKIYQPDKAKENLNDKIEKLQNKK